MSVVKKRTFIKQGCPPFFILFFSFISSSPTTHLRRVLVYKSWFLALMAITLGLGWSKMRVGSTPYPEK